MGFFIRGVNWSVFQQIVFIAINYISLIVLSFYVAPSDFGIVALSSVLLGLFETINGFGIPQLIVKDQIVDKKRIGYLFSTCIGLSLALGIISATGGVIYAQWYSYEIRWEIVKVIGVSSIGMLFSSTSSFYNSFYQRDLDFKTPAIFYVSCLLLANLFAIVIAYNGGGYWSLVFRNLGTSVLIALSFFFFSKYQFILSLHPQITTGEKKFSLWLSGNQLVNYMSRNLDYLIIGKFFDVSVVGQYSIAYRLMLFPMKFLSSRVSNVLYPTLSLMQRNPKRQLDFYVKTVSFIGFITFPLMGLISVLAPIWVPIVFNSQEYNLLPYLIQWLSIAGAFQAVTSPIGSLYLATNKVKIMARYSLASALIFFTGYLIGAWSGDIFTFALYYVILSVLINYFVANFVPLHVLNYEYTQFIKSTLPPLIPVAVAYFCSLFLLEIYQFQASIKHYFMLGCIGLLFILIYLITYGVLFRNDFTRKLRKLKEVYT